MFVTLANSAEIASQSSTQLNDNPLQPQTLPCRTQPANAEYPQNPATVCKHPLNKQDQKPKDRYQEKLIPTEDNLKQLERSFAKAREEGMKKFKQGAPSLFVEVKD